MIYVQPELKSPYSADYLVQAIGWMLLIVTNNLMTLVIFFSALIAYCKPQLMVNEDWQTRCWNLKSHFNICNLATFVLFPFIDLFQVFVIFSDIDWQQKYRAPTDAEKFLNAIVRVVQVLAATVLGCILSFFISSY
jgi:hypothetical protein